MPTVDERKAAILGHRGFEAAIERPVRLDLRGVLPVADREAGQVRRAESGRLGDDRSLDRDAEEVRLELELLDERRFGNGVVYLNYRTRS